MSAKVAFPATRKNGMYDFSIILKRYRDLRSRSHGICLSAAQSAVGYERMKMVMIKEADNKESTSGEKGCISYGPVLPQTAELDSGDLAKVLDPVHVQGRGAPKKRLQAKVKKQRSKGKCGYCGEQGHNRRTCKKLIEANELRGSC